MIIHLTPQRREGLLAVNKAGDTLTINGTAFDFGSLPDGATIPAGDVPCDWIAGPVERIDGKLHLTLILPHGADPSHAVAFPLPLTDPPDGLLDLPRDPEPIEPEEESADVDA